MRFAVSMVALISACLLVIPAQAQRVMNPTFESPDQPNAKVASKAAVNVPRARLSRSLPDRVKVSRKANGKVSRKASNSTGAAASVTAAAAIAVTAIAATIVAAAVATTAQVLPPAPSAVCCSVRSSPTRASATSAGGVPVTIGAATRSLPRIAGAIAAPDPGYFSNPGGTPTDACA